MQKVKLIIGLFALSTVFFSCGVGKKLAYLQDLNDTTRIQEVRVAAFEPLKLQPDDQVQVSITSKSPEGSQLFAMMGTNITSGTSNQVIQNVYTISSKGTINMPLIGELTVGGLTTEQAREVVQKEAVQYVRDAMVGLSLMNFRITVMGEVTRPTTLQVAGEKVNVLEALGMAGDLTVFGKRNNIKVIRKAGDKVEVAHLNLNSSKVMRSPFYNLRQNDIVYVEPVKRKGFAAETSLGVLPTIISVVTLGFLIFRYTR
ncbi:MAG: polysaccharide biosynthesis/export family protein [Agriterribacter sp.]